MVNAVTYILDGDSTVQGLVGLRESGGSDYKVFPVVVFESESAPYIVVRQSGLSSIGKNCGYNYSVDIISYAKSYDAVHALAAAVKNAVLGQSPGTINGVDYGYLNLVTEADGEYIKDHGLYTRITTVEGYGG